VKQVKVVCDCCGKEVPPEDTGKVKWWWWYDPKLHALVCACPECWSGGKRMKKEELSKVTKEGLKRYEEKLDLATRKELEDLRAMREAARRSK